jgi:RND family efflux transporter MFP subunit
MRQRATNAIAAAAAVAAFQLAACGERNQYVEPPPPKVTVAVPEQRPVTRYREATGNAAAINSTDLVARVSGFIQQINYQDGDQVKKGTLLFTIEPEPYKVKLEQAKAAQVGAEATLKQAQATLQRQTELLPRQTTTQASYDQALATRDSAQATLDQAKSNSQLAQISYDYAHVTAPFDGTVSARQVSVGQYVGGSGTPTVLATIVQHDPIYVNFNLNEQDVLEIREEIARRGITREELKTVPIEIALQTDTGYPHHGTLDYYAPTINQTTGTLAVRAILPNPGNVLLPGYFVRVRIPRPGSGPALLIPDIALGSDQGGRYMLVVDKDNVIEQRKVVIGPLIDTMRVIDGGLNADDRVVIGGLLRALPGQKVDPQVQAAATPAR